MWPSIFEFHWDTGHMIFLGIFYAVVITMATSLVYVFVKSIIDTFGDNGDADRHELAEGGGENKLL
jgi:hypothetical protein